MIAERLRLMFVAERRPLLIRYLVFAVALFPIPMIRTGWAEIALVFTVFPFRMPATMGPWMFVWGALLSLPVIPLFVAWSLPGADRVGLPKRSIGVLCLLIAYHPFRYYLEGVFLGPETLATVAEIHERLPAVWLFKHLDTVLLVSLVVWATRRRRTVQRKEKVWFHWLLFVCALWAICGYYDFSLGFFVAFLYT
jgi:hypothetical protein